MPFWFQNCVQDACLIVYLQPVWGHSGHVTMNLQMQSIRWRSGSVGNFIIVQPTMEYITTKAKFPDLPLVRAMLLFSSLSKVSGLSEHCNNDRPKIRKVKVESYSFVTR